MGCNSSKPFDDEKQIASEKLATVKAVAASNAATTVDGENAPPKAEVSEEPVDPSIPPPTPSVFAVKPLSADPVSHRAITTFHCDDNEEAPDAEFVKHQGAHLTLAGERFKFVSVNAPELLNNEKNGKFEIDDTMKTVGAAGAFGKVPVVRTYTLRIKSQYVTSGHINGWNSSWGDWEWSEDRMKEFDYVLDSAARYGVRLIIPVINNDFGNESTNWVGNLSNLVRMRKGISTYADSKKVDFWRDTEMINAVKLILDKLLSRVNTINGKIYGQDPVVLCWETGNELAENTSRPAPASWTLAIARHIKARAPKALVMDGSFAKTNASADRFPVEVLRSDLVDIMSYHYYGTGETSRLASDAKLAIDNGKTFVAGEFGFMSSTDDYGKFLEVAMNNGINGALIWSLRPHSSKGGFNLHSEGTGNIYAYHVPGWSNPINSYFWDSREMVIVRHLRNYAYWISGTKTPDWPVPEAPASLWTTTTSSGAKALAWQGSAWGDRYELICKRNGITVSTRQVWDCTGAGNLKCDLTYELNAAKNAGSGGTVTVRLKALSVDLKASAESYSITI